MSEFCFVTAKVSRLTLRLLSHGRWSSRRADENQQSVHLASISAGISFFSETLADIVRRLGPSSENVPITGTYDYPWKRSTQRHGNHWYLGRSFRLHEHSNVDQLAIDATHIIFCAETYDIKLAVIPVKQQTVYSYDLDIQV